MLQGRHQYDEKKAPSEYLQARDLLFKLMHRHNIERHDGERDGVCEYPIVIAAYIAHDMGLGPEHVDKMASEIVRLHETCPCREGQR